MAEKRTVKEEDLAVMAKSFRKNAGKSKADVARELGVAPPTVFSAEEKPQMSLTKLRIRMIEAYSPFEVIGPVFMLMRK